MDFQKVINPAFIDGWKSFNTKRRITQKKLEDVSFDKAIDYIAENFNIAKDDEFEDKVLAYQKAYKFAYNNSTGQTKPGTNYMFAKSFSYYRKIYGKKVKDSNRNYRPDIIRAFVAGYKSFSRNKNSFEMAIEYSLFPDGNIETDDNKIDLTEKAFMAGFDARSKTFSSNLEKAKKLARRFYNHSL